MRKLIPTIIISLLSTCFIYGQQQADTNKSVFTPIIGLNSGIILSRFYYEIQNGTNPSFSAYKLERKFRNGFAAGLTISLFNTKYFAFQPEVFYQLINHDVNYHSSFQDMTLDSSSKTTADYSLQVSSFQISAMFKIKTGKEFKTYIGLGPYINIPFVNKTKGQIDTYGYGHNVSNFDTIVYNKDIKVNLKSTFGLFVAAGLSIPYRQNNFGAEFRTYFCPNTIILDVPIRQFYYTLCLTYQLKFNKNAW